MEARNNFTPMVPVHPGEILGLELQERGITQMDFAKTIGISKQNLNDYIKGKRSFTSDFSLKLEAALGIAAESFMNLQVEYELTLKRRELRNTEEPIVIEYC